jgi:hypothetical protein
MDAVDLDHSHENTEYTCYYAYGAVANPSLEIVSLN